MDARIKSIKPGSPYATPPDIMGCDYMMDMAAEIGLSRSKEPVSYQEIAAYCQTTGVRLSSWEGQTLREMSVAYCDWCVLAKDPNCQAPTYRDTRTKEQMRQDVDRAIRAKFEGLAKRNKRRSK